MMVAGYARGVWPEGPYPRPVGNLTWLWIYYSDATLSHPLVDGYTQVAAYLLVFNGPTLGAKVGW